MKIEKQVCSLELSKKMKELGFIQDSLFWWAKEKRIEVVKGKWKMVDKGIVLGHYGYKEDSFVDTEHYSAYTVAELGEMLGARQLGVICCINDRIKNNIKWGWTYFSPKGREVEVFATTEADARAKMLIYLAENNLINPKEIV